MSKVRLATAWLDGCSGCHMSLLDMDEKILDVASKVELVYSPLVDHKEFPEGVDATIIEGAVSSVEDEHKLRDMRAKTRILVALGDCGVTSNVPAMRNQPGREACLKRAYLENAQTQPQVPTQVVPELLPRARPLHEFVKVDLYVPGCPPPAELIHFAVAELIEGRMPDLGTRGRFG